MMDALFDDTDFCTLLLPTFIMLYIGQYCVKSAPTAQAWGKRIASVTFLFILGAELLTGDYSDPMTIAGTTVSALMIAGMMLGLSWTVLPLPLSLFEQTVGEGFGHLSQWKRKRQQQRNKKQQERKRQERQSRSEEDWERNAPVRERQQQEKEQRRLKQVKEQHRREEVRLRCQLLYDNHAHELQDKLAPERLEDYFIQYLSDNYPAEMVEQRGELLREMIEQSLDPQTNDQLEFNSIQEIALYFREQQTEIEKLEYDEMTLQTIKAALSSHEEVLIRDFMSRKR